MTSHARSIWDIPHTSSYQNPQYKGSNFSRTNDHEHRHFEVVIPLKKKWLGEGNHCRYKSTHWTLTNDLSHCTQLAQGKTHIRFRQHASLASHSLTPSYTSTGISHTWTAGWRFVIGSPAARRGNYGVQVPSRLLSATGRRWMQCLVAREQKQGMRLSIGKTVGKYWQNVWTIAHLSTLTECFSQNQKVRRISCLINKIFDERSNLSFCDAVQT